MNANQFAEKYARLYRSVSRHDLIRKVRDFSGSRSMQPEFRAERLELGRLDELCMADHDSMQRAFELFLPEF
jgi:hypothetical protein